MCGWLFRFTMMRTAFVKQQQLNQLFDVMRHCIFSSWIVNFYCLVLVYFTDDWHCCIHFDRMGIDKSIDCHATDATWKLLVYWIVCADRCRNTHTDHCIFGLLRRAQRIPMHVGYGKCALRETSNWGRPLPINSTHKWLMCWCLCRILQFFCFLLVVLVAEIATGVYAYQYRDKLNELVQFHVKETVQKEYNVSDTKTTIFDVFQTNVSASKTPHHSKVIFERNFIYLHP